ncbi:MAG: caspase family protein [Xenococcaceae cyanobacterium]
MCPVALPKPRLSTSFTTELSKLWILLVGVNQYQDSTIPSLRYSALDCQGLGEALKEATEAFPAKEVRIHHDFANLQPTLETIRHSWQEIVSAAKPQDTVLFYFSGHGFYDPSSQQVVLCLRDTKQDRLLETGFGLRELLHWLGNCAASQQLIWLDACHSGGMTLRGNMGKDTRTSLISPTPELVKVLRQKASKSQGFYALLSCDRTQQSWEFPELGHGVFTYYLMRGLRGEAADSQGIIEADALYQYVYHQTLRYIDKTNQQIRLINQQKSGRGEKQLLGEYPLQTPKRIVEGFGKVILGKRSLAHGANYYRQALVIDAASENKTTLSLSKVLGNTGGFNLEYLPKPNREWSEVKSAIRTCLRSELVDEMTTALLYLRARVEETDEGEAWLVFREGVRISRSWLRQALRRSSVAQQIVILDCPGAHNLADWVDDLKSESERGQCIIAAAATVKVPEQFSQALLKTLKQADSQIGLPVAAWIAQLQGSLAETKIVPEIWLSAAKGVIEVLPGRNEPKNSSDDSGIFDLGFCPYMGLKAFSEEQAQYFYGRETLTQQLIEKISHSSTLAVVGASGSGKSSVVRAGLLAQLRQGKQLPGSERWWIGCMRPSVNPIEGLLKLMVNPGSENERAEEQMQLEELLALGVEGFVQWLRTRPEPMVVLAIDQFEELFTLAFVNERQRFLYLILGAVKYAADRFKLVLTLRADFVSSCLEIPELATILQTSSVLVPPYLVEEDYRQAIVRPAKQVGLRVESGLVEILLKELDRAAGDLPLLQFALEKLWEFRQHGVLTIQTYQKLGGIRGALEQQAQSVYDSLDLQAQDCARWIFLNLTQLGEGTEDTRRRVSLNDLIVSKYPKALVDRTLQALTAAKIVVVNIEQGIGGGARGETAEPPKPEDWVAEKLKNTTTVEIVHEILIRHWSTLRWWLEENRARLRSQRQIEQAAQLWKNNDRQSEFLLRGIRLAEAEELYLKYTDELSDLALAFIAACLDTRQKEKKEAITRLRRAQAAAAAIGFLGVAAFGLAGLAYRQKLLAQVQEIDALDSSSEALSFSKRSLESAIVSVKAGKKLNQIGSLGQALIGNDRWTQTRLKTVTTLQQAAYNTQELNRLEKHTQRINAVEYSPDGQMLASASDDNTVLVWHKDGTLLSTLAGHQERVTSIAFSPDGQYLVSASADRTVKIWQLNREYPSQTQILRTLDGHQDWVTCVAFSPDGQYIASASRDRSVKLWKINGSIVSTITDSGWINAIKFSPDGKLLASGGEDNTVKLWRIDGQNQLENKPKQTLLGHGDRITSIAFSPDGKQLASGGEDLTVKLWQTADGKALNSFTFRDRLNSVRFSPKGDAIAAAGADGIVAILGLDGSVRQSLLGHGSEISSLSFSPDGKFIASASTDKTVRLWQVARQLKEQEAGTSRVRFSPTDSQLFATAGFDGKIKLWRHTEGNSRKLVRTLAGHKMTVGDLQFSPDGKILISAGWDKTVKLWRVEDGAELKTLKKHQDGVTSLAFSPDGKMFASGSEDRTVEIWKITGGEAQSINTLQGHLDGIISLAFSPDGKFVASGSYDKAIKIWRVDDGLLVSDLKKQGLAIAALKFSTDGKILASASLDNTIQLWRIVDLNSNSLQDSYASGVKPFKTLAGHQGGVTSLDFTNDGKVLVSASDDGTIKFWNVQDCMLIKTLFGHNSKVLDLNFNLSDRTLVSTEEQAGLFIWNLESNDLLKRTCQNLKNYLQTNPNVSQEDSNLCS